MLMLIIIIMLFNTGLRSIRCVKKCTKFETVQLEIIGSILMTFGGDIQESRIEFAFACFRVLSKIIIIIIK